jgi:hypothetical protein
MGDLPNAVLTTRNPSRELRTFSTNFAPPKFKIKQEKGIHQP